MAKSSGCGCLMCLVFVGFVMLLNQENREPSIADNQEPSGMTSGVGNEVVPAGVSVAIPAGVEYEIIGETKLRTVKRSLDIRISTAVGEEVLRNIAAELKSRDPQHYERTFICYYLPGMEVDKGAWATTHYDSVGEPGLHVRFVPFALEANPPDGYTPKIAIEDDPEPVFDEELPSEQIALSEAALLGITELRQLLEKARRTLDPRSERTADLRSWGEFARRFNSERDAVEKLIGQTHPAGRPTLLSFNLTQASWSLYLMFDALGDGNPEEFAKWEREYDQMVRDARTGLANASSRNDANSVAERRRNGEASRARREEQVKELEELDGDIAEFSRLAKNLGGLVASVGRSGTRRHTVKIVATDDWGRQPYQLRLQTAESLWSLWSSNHECENVDDARITIVDSTGYEIGGSRASAGSKVWVQE